MLGWIPRFLCGLGLNEPLLPHLRRSPFGFFLEQRTQLGVPGDRSGKLKQVAVALHFFLCFSFSPLKPVEFRFGARRKRRSPFKKLALGEFGGSSDQSEGSS